MKGWLVDKSALWKMTRSPDYDTWVNRVNRGLLWACLPTRLEIAFSALDADHWPVLRSELLDPLLDAPTTARSEHIAMEIVEALITARLQAAVPPTDILIASVAVVERLTVLHDDRDFERIRDAYGEPAVERLVLDRS